MITFRSETYAENCANTASNSHNHHQTNTRKALVARRLKMTNVNPIKKQVVRAIWIYSVLCNEGITSSLL